MQLPRPALLIIALLCSLLASCGNGGGANTPSDGRAGQVLQLQGVVVATRSGQEPRALAKTDLIYVDDAIEVSENASASILFTHNNATWQLSSGYKGTVESSLAWRTKQHEASTLTRSDTTQTAAAGRNSEREAAESVETLEEAKQGDSPAKTQAIKGLGSDKGRAGNAPAAGAELEPAIKGRQIAAQSEGKRKRTTKRSKPTVELTAESASVLRVPPNQMGSGSSGRELKIGSGANAQPARVSKRASETESPIIQTAPAPPKAINSDAAKTKRLLRRIAKACVAKHKGTGTVSIRFVVSNSKIKNIELGGPSVLSATKKCIQTKLRAIKHKGSFSVNTSIPFQ